MDQKVEQAPRRTLQAGSADDGSADDGLAAGFTLLEVVCVLAIVAILAAILLPIVPRGTSRARLESYAIETAAMLKVDRNIAMRKRVPAMRPTSHNYNCSARARSV